MRYKNPIIPGFNPDPSIVRVDKDYYLVTSSFEYYPGVPVYHSKDLINWEHIGYCLERHNLNLEGVPCSGGIYAPTIRYHDGVFYMCATNVSHGGNFYVSARNPEGPWSEPLYVDFEGIDPSLFFDEDGKVYFMTNEGLGGGRNISIAQIDIETGRLLSNKHLAWKGSGGRCIEAPHVYKIGEWYYMLCAEGGTQYGHMVTVARSRTVFGPYEGCPHNPILSQRDCVESEIQCTGHGDLVCDHNGNWWIVFLGIRNATRLFHHLGRETFLMPLEWDGEGWAKKVSQVEAEVEADCLSPVSVEPAPARGSFKDLCWNYLRNPNLELYNLESEGASLLGSRHTLNDIASPTFMCRRQQHFNCKVSSLLNFEPQNEGEEAGLAAYYNNEHHYEIAVTKKEGQKCVLLRRTIGDLSAITACEPLENGPVLLSIEADREQYSFSFQSKSYSPKHIGKGRTQFLSTEVTKVSFTGVFLGVYATGNGRQSSEWADFGWFEYNY